jgi:hypothetical protein
VGASRGRRRDGVPVLHAERDRQPGRVAVRHRVDQLGATVDGPSSPGNFGLGTVTGMRACSHGSYGAFGNGSAGYEDNVVSWPSVEPSLDYSAISLLAFAFGGAGLG